MDMGGTDIRDENFVDELLDGLPGIDANDMDEIANMDELLMAVDDGADEDADGGNGDKEEQDDAKKSKKKKDSDSK